MIRRVRIHPDNHLRPGRVTIAEGGVLVAYAMGSPVDRIQMHRRMQGGNLGAILDMTRDGIVG